MLVHAWEFRRGAAIKLSPKSSQRGFFAISPARVTARRLRCAAVVLGGLEWGGEGRGVGTPELGALEVEASKVLVHWGNSRR